MDMAPKRAHNGPTPYSRFLLSADGEQRLGALALTRGNRCHDFPGYCVPGYTAHDQFRQHVSTVCASYRQAMAIDMICIKQRFA